MKFIHSDLGYLKSGEIIEVILSGSAANVQLLDHSNFQNYKAGRKFKYIGGLAKKSPVLLEIPRSAHWHIAVDMNGLKGNVRASIKVVPQPKPLPEMKYSTPRPTGTSIPILQASTSPLARLVNPLPDEQVDFDVFISHASEDKDAVARPLAESLENYGLNVWYDESTLRIGDSLRRKIDNGIYRSRFSVVILSNAFIAKGWTNYEFDGIIARANANQINVLPIWHNIDATTVAQFSPSIADKVARDTATHTIPSIAKEIVQAIRGEDFPLVHDIEQSTNTTFASTPLTSSPENVNRLHISNLDLMRASLKSLIEQAPASVDALGYPFKKSSPFHDCLRLLIAFEHNISNYPNPLKTSTELLILREDIKQLAPWMSIYNQWDSTIELLPITDEQKNVHRRTFFNMLTSDEQALLSLCRLSCKKDKYHTLHECHALPVYSAQAGLAKYFLQRTKGLSFEEAYFHAYILGVVLQHEEEAAYDLLTNEETTLENYKCSFYGFPELCKEVTAPTTANDQNDSE